MSVLPSNEKNYISFSKFTIIDGQKHEIRFLDSLRILDAGIEQLAYELPTEEMKETINYFPNVPIDILKRKGFYPYDWMDSEEKLNAKLLPVHSNFFSTLKNKNITLDEYEKARQGWKAFNCKNMGDYTRIYCIRDVLLLCDIFENFRKINLKEYDVDPLVSGYTLPGISWANMLRYTKQELKLITDRETYEDFEKGIRGGVSMCIVRHAKANNKYLHDYNPKKPSSYIFYVDENNLYGNSMSKDLPYDIERKMTKLELKDWRKFTCALVVDLEIPKEQHDFLNAFPPAPEHLTINGVKKLVPNLLDKKEYLVYSDECNGKIIREFCGTCAKSYSYMIEGEEIENKKCKGVKDSAIEELTINDYLNCVFKGEEKTVSFNLIHSTGHNIYTEKMEKIALTPTRLAGLPKIPPNSLLSASFRLSSFHSLHSLRLLLVSLASLVSLSRRLVYLLL